MQDRFRGKTWIHWVLLGFFGLAGLVVMAIGVLLWTGILKDAKGHAIPQDSPHAVIGGCFFLALALLQLFNLIYRAAPIIRCYRQGIECNLVGATSLDGVPLVPGIIRILWAIVSLQGFRSQHARIPWEKFLGASIGGFPMAYILILDGTVTIAKTGRVVGQVKFKQVEFVDHPQQVADLLNWFGANPVLREYLPEWKAGTSSRPT